MNEAEYLMKNYGHRGTCVIRQGRRSRRITPSEISLILHMIRKPNSIIVLLFIQNLIIPSLKTNLKHAYLHRC